MTRDAEHTPSPQSVVVPKFGDIVENGWASDDNPTRRGFFVREFKRTGKLNPGRTWEITDGKGKFWEFKPSDIGERLSVSAAPAPSSLAGGEVVSVPALTIDACKGEQEHFEAWAKSKRYEMSEHPLHYIFNDPKTDAARMGWNAALAYVREAALSPEAPAREGVKYTIRQEYGFGITEHDPALTPRHEAPAEGAGEALGAAENLHAAAMIYEDQAMLEGAETVLSAIRARSSAPEAREVLERIREMDFKAIYGEANYQKLADDLDALYTHPAAPSADKLRIAVEALEPFSAAFRGLSSRWEGHETHWQDATSPIAVEDLRRADQVLAALQAEQKGGAA